MTHDELTSAMLRSGFFAHDDNVVSEAAKRWIDTFLQAYGEQLSGAEESIPKGSTPQGSTLEEALRLIASLRAESVIVPALTLERLRSRQVLFFLDTVAQYVDDQPELRGLPLEHDVRIIAQEFGIAPEDAFWAVRAALTGKESGPPLELLFPLLGHDRILMRIGAISSHLLHGRGLEPIHHGPGGEPFTPIQGRQPEDG